MGFILNRKASETEILPLAVWSVTSSCNWKPLSLSCLMLSCWNPVCSCLTGPKKRWKFNHFKVTDSEVYVTISASPSENRVKVGENWSVTKQDAWWDGFSELLSPNMKFISHLQHASKRWMSNCPAGSGLIGVRDACYGGAFLHFKWTSVVLTWVMLAR